MTMGEYNKSPDYTNAQLVNKLFNIQMLLKLPSLKLKFLSI